MINLKTPLYPVGAHAPITRKQREAIKRVFDRCPLYASLIGSTWQATSTPRYHGHKALTYRQFRRLVLPTYDCLMVQWCGMWLGIEGDGYVHS